MVIVTTDTDADNVWGAKLLGDCRKRRVTCARVDFVSCLARIGARTSRKVQAREIAGVCLIELVRVAALRSGADWVGI